ncbi:DUF3999 family protein [Saccharicrinis sp. 156]|uniref:DUF3999 family protein n=1 Tax=Saccharicrinis sp. 156 TaxID=3417574 RepID=UPI003D32AD1C
MKSRYIVFLLFILLNSLMCAQIEKYKYKREILNINETWHRLELPDNMFGNLEDNLADIRIYGITPYKDTVEAPYFLKENVPQTSVKKIRFKTINKSHDKNGYYYTFELKEGVSVNEIELDFTRKNFDWQVRLEGSSDSKEWFTILDDYRIVSIVNDFTDFQFNKLSFSSSKYKYLRLFIPATKNPRLSSAALVQSSTLDGEGKKYPVKNFYVTENKKYKTTEIEVDFDDPVRAGKVTINIKSDFDYYRRVSIKLIQDSIETETGWVYRYGKLLIGTLNSLATNDFNFKSTTLKKMLVSIENNDNEPLDIESIEVTGYKHELNVRFAREATYYLFYGNEMALLPKYDIVRFQDQIPARLTALNLGDEERMFDRKNIPPSAIFNKFWLWGVMVVVIVLLAWFSLKMLNGKHSSDDG